MVHLSQKIVFGQRKILSRVVIDLGSKVRPWVFGTVVGIFLIFTALVALLFFIVLEPIRRCSWMWSWWVRRRERRVDELVDLKAGKED